MSFIVIKTQGQLERMRAAGRLTAGVLELIGEHVREGVSSRELDALAYEFITKNGAVPSFLNYHGYPASICASVNDTVIHGIPDDYRLKSGDIISVDVGVFIGGYHGDAARTFTVGAVADDVKKLISVTEECFMKGFIAAQKGGFISDISKAVQQHAEAHGYGVVRDYIGHGVGKAMHEAPEVPNYYAEGMQRIRLREGMTIAIEPMINLGSHLVRTLKDGWTVKTVDGKPSAHYENTIAITANGPEILTKA